MEDYLTTLKKVKPGKPVEPGEPVAADGALLDHMARQMFKYKPFEPIPGSVFASYSMSIPGHYLEDKYTAEEIKDSHDSIMERAVIVETLVTENLRKLGIMSDKGFKINGELAVKTFADFAISYLHGELSKHIGPIRLAVDDDPDEVTVSFEGGQCFVELLHFIVPIMDKFVDRPISPTTHIGLFKVVAGRWLKRPNENLLHRHIYKEYGDLN